AIAGSERIVFSGVEFDSRNIRGGELFVALPGETHHGHEFVPQALERGAALALVEDAAVGSDEPERILAVPDTLEAFQRLAHWWRSELDIPIVAVTGSVGKTTTKEMLANILLEYGVGLYSRKSFNNHVGVPYTLLQMGRQHLWGIVEVGMNHEGEIRRLTKI